MASLFLQLVNPKTLQSSLDFLSYVSKSWQLSLNSATSPLIRSSRAPWRDFPSSLLTDLLLPPLLPGSLFSTQKPQWFSSKSKSFHVSAQSSRMAAPCFSQNKIGSPYSGLQGPTSLGCLVSLSSSSSCSRHTDPAALSSTPDILTPSLLTTASAQMSLSLR